MRPRGQETNPVFTGLALRPGPGPLVTSASPTPQESLEGSGAGRNRNAEPGVGGIRAPHPSLPTPSWPFLAPGLGPFHTSFYRGTLVTY